MQDKKSRFYIVSALADTKVDLKVLSQRLGLGKGGIRMAPEEALGKILQVPLGCVTPFALINESSSHVSLLLDKGFKAQEHSFFHPLSNDMSISLSACDLDKFLKSIGRDPSYVDLEANPPVGKDNPPDLAALVPSDSFSLSDPLENTTPLHASAANPISDKFTAATVKATKPQFVAQDSKDIRASNYKDKPANAAHQPNAVSDVGQFVEEILERTSALLLSEITEETIRQHGEHLGTEVANRIIKRLGPDLKSLATMSKNTAYTQGFYAGAHHQPKRL